MVYIRKKKAKRIESKIEPQYCECINCYRVFDLNLRLLDLHRDEKGYHCPEWKVGLPEEEEPGYFGVIKEEEDTRLPIRRYPYNPFSDCINCAV